MPTPNPALADLARLLQTSDGFEGLSETERSQFIDQMTVMDLDDGHVLIRQDGVVDTLYVVIAGVLAVSAVNRHGAAHSLGELGPGALTGAMNLLLAFSVSDDGRGSWSRSAGGALERWVRLFSGRCPAAAFALTEALRPRLRRARLWTALHLSEMFAQLDRAALMDLESAFEPVPLYGGELLFKQGDAADSLYIVVSGRLRVVMTAADGTEMLLAELGVGETVGEMGVISGEPRSATVYASRDTQLAKLSKTAVDAVVERHPHAMLSMLTSRLITRVRVMSRADRRRAEVATIAVVPAGSDVPHREVRRGSRPRWHSSDRRSTCRARWSTVDSDGQALHRRTIATAAAPGCSTGSRARRSIIASSSTRRIPGCRPGPSDASVRRTAPCSRPTPMEIRRGARLRESSLRLIHAGVRQ